MAELFWDKIMRGMGLESLGQQPETGNELRGLLAEQKAMPSSGLLNQQMTHTRQEPNLSGWGQQHADYWGRVASGDIAREGLQRYVDVFSDPTSPQSQEEILSYFGPGVIGATAYHGSPYLFRALDPSKANTGEGAQAFGVGAGYTSLERRIGENYRAKIAAMQRASAKGIEEPTINGKSINWDNPEEVAAFELSRFAGDRQAAAEFHSKTFLGGENNPVVKLLQSNQELPKVDLPGYLYKGDIPDEIIPNFLNWNQPLKEQSMPIRGILMQEAESLQALANRKNIIRDRLRAKGGKFADRPRIEIEDLTGEEIYRGLFPEARSDQIATDYLNNLGVRGIRYTDPQSKISGNPASNFVVFRPEDYRIQEINDIPLEEWIAKGLLSK